MGFVTHHKKTNICIMGVPEEESERKGQKAYLKKWWLKTSKF